MVVVEVLTELDVLGETSKAWATNEVVKHINTVIPLGCRRGIHKEVKMDPLPVAAGDDNRCFTGI